MRPSRAVVIALVAAALLQPAGAVQKHRTRVRRSGPTFDPTVVNDASIAPILRQGMTGSSVLRAQILLSRAHFSPGEIDGRFGGDMVLAVTAFQRSHKLAEAARVDSKVWSLLNQDASPAVAAYTITAEDAKGPFEPVPADMMEQSKLKALGYASLQEALGERFQISPKLLAALNPGKDLTQAGGEIVAPKIDRTPLLSADVEQVVVSKHLHSVDAISRDGSIVAHYPATMGSEHDPLPIGTWKVTAVQRNPWFNYDPNLFWNAKPEDTKARIAPGPNNPVGVVWIGLTKEHYGIHGTPEPGMIGHTQSHGCIRLTNWDASELAGLVRRGTPVECVE